MTNHRELIEQLRSGQQCDEDGVLCVVSRSASPRPGRSMYVDDAPVIDEIHEGEPAQIEKAHDFTPTADDLARAEAEALAEIERRRAEDEAQ